MPRQMIPVPEGFIITPPTQEGDTYGYSILRHEVERTGREVWVPIKRANGRGWRSRHHAATWLLTQVARGAFEHEAAAS